MASRYQRHECAGTVLLKKQIYAGRSIVRWEVRKLSLGDWPSDQDLLDSFGDCGLGGKVQKAGKVRMVEVVID